MLERVKLSHIIIFIFILLHLVFINNFPLNFEYVFSNLDNFFKYNDYKYIYEYFEDQANTLAFAFFSGYIANTFFPNLDSIYITKVISLSSCILIFLGFKNFYSYFNKRFDNIFLVILFLNPLIWVFSYRGTPDLISASLGFYALSLMFINYRNNKIYIIGSVLLSIAIIFKPHSFIYIVFIFLITFSEGKIFENLKLFLLKNFLMIFLLILYFGYNYYKFGFLIYSENYRSSFQISYKLFFNNLLIYLGYLFLVTSPISINYFFKYKNILKIKVILFLFFSFLFGFLFFEINGEMDLGIFSVNQQIMAGLYLSFLIFGFYSLVKNYQNLKYEKKYFVILLFSIFIYIIILSFVKPAQRYLMSPMLLLYLFYFSSINLNNYKSLFFLVIFILVPINYFLTINSYLNSEITKKILASLENKMILSKTDLGVINSHANFKVKYFLDKKEYKIENINRNSEESYISEFFYFKKIYFLNKI